MSFKPKNDVPVDRFTREIKPNMIPTNILDASTQQVYFNTRGLYKDF